MAEFGVDVEQLLSTWLREWEVLGADVVTEMPGYFATRAERKIVLIQRISGAPTTDGTRWHDRALIQVSAYGGPKKTSHSLVQHVAFLLDLPEFIAAHDDGVVTGVEFGDLRSVPDTGYTPARQRYLLDLAVFTHPLPETVS